MMSAGSSKLVAERRQPTKEYQQRHKSAPFWMKTKSFKKLCSWAFKTCDRNNTGEINQTELYAGLMLVHLNLAKYAGPAACYPPDRSVVDKLFEASDDNDSGGIDVDEFRAIMVILCSEITFRVFSYYFILIAIVPYLVLGGISFLDIIGVDETIRVWNKVVWERFAPSFLQKLMYLIPDTAWEILPETLVSTALFYIAIPVAFNWIDNYSHKVAVRIDTDREEPSSAAIAPAQGERKSE